MSVDEILQPVYKRFLYGFITLFVLGRDFLECSRITILCFMVNMLQQSARSSKVSYGNYSSGSYGAITRGETHDDKPSSGAMQGAFTLEVTAKPQVGDLSGTNEESKGECCELASTTFVDDACSSMATFSAIRAMDDITVKDMGIVDFMMKPFLLQDFQWHTTDVPNTVLYSSAISSVLTANTYWTNKLEGFALFRGTACFKLIINANPFQSGKLIAHFLPGTTNRTELSYTAMHNCNLTAITQQPHVELDARDTALVMKIPYVAPTDFYKLKVTTETFDWGTFYVRVLSDLQVGSGGNTNVDCALYAWFEDVELAGPTVPQSGKKSLKKFKVNTMTREAPVASTAPISTALSFTAKAAESLSAVPIISNVASTAAWVLRGASGVASFFGWSKPICEAPPAPMFKQFARHMANSDGLDNCQTLSLIHDNKITPTDTCSIRDEDEMSFNFLKEVAAFSQSVDWTTSQASGTSLFNLTMHPQNLYTAGTTTYNTHTMNWRNGPPIFYLSNFFTYYRGSFKVILKFVKTDYHTGRVQVTWTPKGYGNTTTPTLTTANLAMRWIVDLRETNLLEVNLPWFIATNYLPVDTGSGQFDVLILNELRAPETASTTVKVLFYFAGGPDFELASPGQNTINSLKPQPFSPQIGELMAASGAIGNNPTDTLNATACSLSHGEMFTSVKQLISRYSCLLTRSWIGSNSWCVYPWAAGVQYLNSSTGARAFPLLGGDIYSVVAPMYAFMRGSVKVLVKASEIPATGTTNSTLTGNILTSWTLRNTVNVILAVPAYSLADSAITNYDNPVIANGFAYSDSGNGVHGFSVPYYNMTKCSQIRINSNTDTVFSDVSTPPSLLNILGVGASTTGTGNYNSRAMGDDFQLSYFIGCPPVTYSYS